MKKVRDVLNLSFWAHQVIRLGLVDGTRIYSVLYLLPFSTLKLLSRYYFTTRSSSPLVYRNLNWIQFGFDWIWLVWLHSRMPCQHDGEKEEIFWEFAIDLQDRNQFDSRFQFVSWHLLFCFVTLDSGRMIERKQIFKIESMLSSLFVCLLVCFRWFFFLSSSAISFLFSLGVRVSSIAQILDQCKGLGSSFRPSSAGVQCSRWCRGLPGFLYSPSIHSLIAAWCNAHSLSLSAILCWLSFHPKDWKEIPVLGMLASIPSDIELSSPFFLLYLLLFLLLFFHSFFFAFLHSLFPPFCYICYNRLVARLSWLPGRSSSSSRRRKGIDRLCLFPLLLQHGLHFMMTFLTVNAILKGLDLLAEIQSTPILSPLFLFFWFGFDHPPPL